MNRDCRETRGDRGGSCGRGHGRSSTSCQRGEVLTDWLMTTFGRELLNAGEGVLEVAGGRGDLSFTIAMAGLPVTLVDPRVKAGLLTKSLRKRLRKAGRSFRRIRRYFGTGAECAVGDQEPVRQTYNGVDYLHTDAYQSEPGFDLALHTGNGRHFPFYDLTNDDEAVSKAFNECSVIVACHPDEAAGATVDFAVAHKKPFAIVPCCVFSRLFPDRRTQSGDAVKTHEQLLDYLQAKHPSIKRCTLEFEGCNTVLWTKSFPQEC